jgi:hypothetical protein
MDFSKSDMRGLKQLALKSPGEFRKAQEKATIQLLTWMNMGSPGTSAKPPIRFGVLRGSSSAFVGSSKLKDFSITIKPGSKETISPAGSYSAPDGTTTIVYNTDYAAKMHEWEGTWGDFTIQDGDAGNKWIEKHLQADKDLFMKVIGIEVKKGLNL